MVNVLCWKNTIETLLALKASYTNIGEGSETIKIENKEFSISYSNDMISVFEQEIPVSAENLTHTKAIEAVFGIDGYLTFSNRKTGCFPLPFYMNNADTF